MVGSETKTLAGVMFTVGIRKKMMKPLGFLEDR